MQRHFDVSVRFCSDFGSDCGSGFDSGSDCGSGFDSGSDSGSGFYSDYSLVNFLRFFIYAVLAAMVVCPLVLGFIPGSKDNAGK